MKAIVVTVVSVALVVGVVIYEEGRISTLEKEVAALKKEPVSSNGSGSRGSGSRGAGLVPASPGSLDAKGDRTGSRLAPVAGGEAAKDGKSKEGDWAETFRKMIENPVGAAMIKEENKGKALRMYGNFIDSLNFNKEEKEYFLGLVAGGVGEEDAVGMKLFGAKTDEERIAILDQMEADQAARRKAVREFLNNEEDFARYEHFEDRKQIYEQMPGLRAAMTASGAPITPPQEEQIVEAIYQASVQSGLQQNWEGRAGMEQFGEPGAAERFKEQWAGMQGILEQNTGTILQSPEQQTALREHQVQVGNMVTMSLQFVEGMIAAQRNGGE